MKFSKDFKEIKGDASFRKFYRKPKKIQLLYLQIKKKLKIY